MYGKPSSPASRDRVSARSNPQDGRKDLRPPLHNVLKGWRSRKNQYQKLFAHPRNAIVQRREVHAGLELDRGQSEGRLLCMTNQFARRSGMDTSQAAHTLEVIRTLMERTCQYRLLTAGASLAAARSPVLGALAFRFSRRGRSGSVRGRLGFRLRQFADGQFRRHHAARPGSRRTGVDAADAAWSCWR